MDDEAAQVTALVRSLGKEGCEVSGVHSATEALAALRASRFQILITDLRCLSIASRASTASLGCSRKRAKVVGLNDRRIGWPLTLQLLRYSACSCTFALTRIRIVSEFSSRGHPSC